MLKITTRIFTASAMGALLICFNTGAFACDGCIEGAAQIGVKSAAATKTVATKTAAKPGTVAKIAKGAKPVAKVVASAKFAPTVAKKSFVKPVAVAAKTVMQPCPMCEQEKESAKS